MSCAEYRSALTVTALRGSAPPGLATHLEGCAACRARLEDERHLVGRLDAEVRSTLEVEPSPALVPRVRQRLETEGSRSAYSWRLAWLVPAAALPIVVALDLGRRAPEDRPPVPEVAGRRDQAPVAPSLAPAGAPVVASTSTPPTARPIRPAAARPTSTKEPAVLIPPEEQAAVQRFVEGLRRRVPFPTATRVDLDPVRAADIGATDTIDPEALTVSPLEVKPLTPDSIAKE